MIANWKVTFKNWSHVVHLGSTCQLSDPPKLSRDSKSLPLSSPLLFLLSNHRETNSTSLTRSKLMLRALRNRVPYPSSRPSAHVRVSQFFRAVSFPVSRVSSIFVPRAAAIGDLSSSRWSARMSTACRDEYKLILN